MEIDNINDQLTTRLLPWRLYWKLLAPCASALALIFPNMLSHGLLSFKSLAPSCCLLSLKEAVEAISNYRNHSSIIGSPLYCMRQSSENLISSHTAYGLIAKILEKIVRNFEWVVDLFTKFYAD